MRKERKGPTEQTYARFLEWLLGLLVALTLAVMWVMGAALLGACALIVYFYVTALLRMVA